MTETDFKNAVQIPLSGGRFSVLVTCTARFRQHMAKRSGLCNRIDPKESAAISCGWPVGDSDYISGI
jgi:hypothetical protein